MKQKTFWISCLVVLLWASAGWAISLVDADWLKKNLDNKSIRIVEVPEKANKVYDGSWLEWATLLSLPAEDQVWYTEKK
ncbi:MAG: hypothetical protein HZA15_10160 [Nitrospirae bacterium]|nr:hypothetical protein [Nitrospirota bacterium]